MHSLLLSLLAAVSAVEASQNPAAFGPPSDSDPLTWGFYATPEVSTPVSLEVKGEFPRWLEGSLYRGAAGTWDVGNYTAEHWFDGFSRSHRFEISDGIVSYRSRNSSDELVDFVRETGMYPGGGFGLDPCKIIFGAMEQTFRNGINPVGDSNTADISVGWIMNLPGLSNNDSYPFLPFNNLVRTTESNQLQAIDPIDLEPIELFNYQFYNLALNESGRMAAHGSHYEDGSMYNYNLLLDEEPPKYQVFGVLNKDDGQAETRILANITDAAPAYIHSTFQTEKYIILIVWQSDYAKPGTTMMSSFGEWDPERKSLFYVIDRHAGGVVAKFISDEAFFAFHQINSFEEPETGDILVDLPTMETNAFLWAANVTSLRANLGDPGASAFDVPGNFTRFRLPMSSAIKTQNVTTSSSNGKDLDFLAAITEFSLDFRTHNIELPRINEEYISKPYRYAYGVHLEKKGYFADSIIKVDTHTQEAKVWLPETNIVPCEPIFVPSPPGGDDGEWSGDELLQEEDDGVLLTIVMDQKRGASSLVVLNATTMAEMGRADMPVVMGYGFHGAWGGASGLASYN